MIGDLATFALAGAIIVLAGVTLTRAADDLAERTGLGRLWMGAVLLAAATSLPELGVNVAATRQGAIDLAVGNIFGSNMFNMLILAALGLVPPRDEVFRRSSPDHALAAVLGVSLQAIAALLIATQATTHLAGVSPYSLLLVALFAVGTWIIYRQSNPDASEDQEARVRDRAGWRLAARPALRFAGAALVILVAAPMFSASAESLAIASGLGSTLFGTLFVGAATSLPEIVACVAAVRMGAFDLAVGNLFGSNLFNVTILFAMDLVDAGGGSVFARISPVHLVTALFGILLTALGSASIAFRATRRWALVEPGSVLMIIAYAAAVAALVQLRVAP